MHNIFGCFKGHEAQLVLNLKENSFNVLRLVLALSVLVAHSFELGGFGYDPLYYFSGNVYSIGAIAVDCFFAISGLLITSSYKNINSFAVFFWHRIIRIFPGYWFCIVVTALVVPSAFNIKPDFMYIVHNSFQPAISCVQSLIGLLVPLIIGWSPDLGSVEHKLHFFGQGYLEGVFGGQAINGSLWSLSQEFRLYCLIAFLGLTGLLKKPVLLFLLAFSWVTYCIMIMGNPSWEGLAKATTFRATAHFLSGAVFYFYRPVLSHSFAAIALLMAAVTLKLGCYAVVSPLVTMYLIAYLAIVIPFYEFGRDYDFSYGAYVFAFPIQKVLAAMSLNRFGLLVYFLLSLFFTMIFAYVSWTCVERHALKLRKLTIAKLLGRKLKLMPE